LYFSKNFELDEGFNADITGPQNRIQGASARHVGHASLPHFPKMRLDLHSEVALGFVADRQQ